MSKKCEQNNTEQTSALSFGSSNISEKRNELAKNLSELNLDKSETIISSNKNSEYNPQLIPYKENNTSFASKNNESKPINIKNNSQSDINKSIDIKKIEIFFQNSKDKPNESIQSQEELEKHQENKSISYNKNKNKDLSLTKLNSNGSGNILPSSIFSKADEKPEAINKDNDSEISEISGPKTFKQEDENKTQKLQREIIKSAKKIKKFREKYNILDINKYSNKFIYFYMKENNFDEEKAFESILKYINT